MSFPPQILPLCLNYHVPKIMLWHTNMWLFSSHFLICNHTGKITVYNILSSMMTLVWVYGSEFSSAPCCQIADRYDIIAVKTGLCWFLPWYFYSLWYLHWTEINIVLAGRTGWQGLSSDRIQGQLKYIKWPFRCGKWHHLLFGMGVLTVTWYGLSSQKIHIATI